jgi:hypothetical protein
MLGSLKASSVAHPNRLMAVTGAPGVGKLKSAVIVQPTRGSITARHEISGSLVDAAASEDALAVLTALVADEVFLLFTAFTNGADEGM